MDEKNEHRRKDAALAYEVREAADVLKTVELRYKGCAVALLGWAEKLYDISDKLVLFSNRGSHIKDLDQDEIMCILPYAKRAADAYEASMYEGPIRVNWNDILRELLDALYPGEDD